MLELSLKKGAKTFKNEYIIGDVKGIPINVLLKKLSEQSSNSERHKFYPRVAVKNTDISAEEDVDSVKNYVEDIEKDFASSAQNVLDQLNLSHLMTRKKG